MTANITRLCPECRTDNCFYPLEARCHTCEEARVAFMNSPLYYQEIESNSVVSLEVAVSPMDIFQRVIQPWKTLLDFLTCN